MCKTTYEPEKHKGKHGGVEIALTHEPGTKVLVMGVPLSSAVCLSKWLKNEKIWVFFVYKMRKSDNQF